MYFAVIISIAWLYITVLMAATQESILAGLATLFFYGLIPVGLVFYIATTKHRRRKKIAQDTKANPNTRED